MSLRKWSDEIMGGAFGLGIGLLLREAQKTRISEYWGQGEKVGNLRKWLDEEKVPLPNNEVKILSGWLDGDVWNYEKFKNQIYGINEKEITPKVITGPNIDDESKNQIRELLERRKIELRELNREVAFYFIVIDDTWAHIEEKHERGKKPKGSLAVKSLYPGRSKWFRRKFSELWNEAKPIREID